MTPRGRGPLASEENTRQDVLRVRSTGAAAGGGAKPGPGTGKEPDRGPPSRSGVFPGRVIPFPPHIRRAVAVVRGRMAAGQLLPRPTGGTRDPGRHAAGLLSPASKTNLRSPVAGTRVFTISPSAWWPVSDARLDLEEVREYVSFYQDTRPLTTGELWALPVMLRLTLLDNLGQYLSQITGLPRPVAPSRAWPLRSDLTADAVVANCFMSLPAMAAYDWRQFFEDVSRLEQVLRADPAAVYGQMDRDSRDRYRKIVEEMALCRRGVTSCGWRKPRSNWQRRQRARRAGRQAGRTEGRAAPDLSAVSRTAHVGYYLLGPGRGRLDAGAGAIARPRCERLVRWALRHPTPTYLVPIGLLTLLGLYAAWTADPRWGATRAQGIPVLALVLVPAVTVAVAIVDWLVMLLVPARVLAQARF